MFGKSAAAGIRQDILSLSGAKYLMELAELSLNHPKRSECNYEIFNFISTDKYVDMGATVWLNLKLYNEDKAKGKFAKENRGIRELLRRIWLSTPKDIITIIVHKLIDEINNRSDSQQIIRGIKLRVAADDLSCAVMRDRVVGNVSGSLYKYLLTADIDDLGWKLEAVIIDLIMNPEEQINDIIYYTSDESIINHLFKTAIVTCDDFPRQLGTASKEEKLKALAEIMTKEHIFKPYLSELNPLFNTMFTIPPAPEVPTIN